MRRLWLTLLLMLASPAWSQTLVASVEPLAKVLRGLYGDQVQVVTLLQANQNPHQLALSPRQAMLVQQADLLVWLGETVEAPLAPLVARRQGATLTLLELEGVHRREGDHNHEHDHEHHDSDHGDATLDPHLWLSLDNMMLLAGALAQRYPQGLKAGEPARWQQQAKDRHARHRQALAGLEMVPWLSYHQPWGYLTETLGLAEPLVVSQQLDAGPGSRRFVALAGEIRDQQVRCAILEPEARAAMVSRLCPDCQIHPLDPLGRDHPELDYLTWRDHLVEGFKACLQAGAG
ncbi:MULTISPECIES: metal ABC transporter substrate-binding protein [Alcanivorax]|uniref:metal ABC transporter substrate-binding protein n=1 Tax=Alcanivorax TaxID=59753 RepID=UPI0025B97DB0|nr:MULTISPECIES: metal ABC transporter substrate-binding protein [Alcanivorax]